MEMERCDRREGMSGKKANEYEREGKTIEPKHTERKWCWCEKSRERRNDRSKDADKRGGGIISHSLAA